MAEPAQPQPKSAPAPAPALKVENTLKLPTAVLALDAASDGRKLYAACLDGSVREVDTESGRHEVLGRHDSYASGVWLLPKRRVVISAGYDGALQWHDLEKRALIRKVQAHRFWSWQLAASPDERLVASVTGQYLAGGYKYEPAAGEEPAVRLYDVATGELRHSLALTPPVLAVAFSPDSRQVAAGNMMGDLRIWDTATGRELAAWNTPDFTSWGVIKSHHYIGGVFALTFSPAGDELLACGMGSMRDPMAGNGKQKWQRFAWREKPARKAAEIHDDDRGNGLMETILYHPTRPAFLMAGRLAQGKWTTALFATDTGRLLASLDSKMRVTDAAFAGDGSRLFLGGAVGQEKKKDGRCPDFGRIQVVRCTA